MRGRDEQDPVVRSRLGRIWPQRFGPLTDAAAQAHPTDAAAGDRAEKPGSSWGRGVAPVSAPSLYDASDAGFASLGAPLDAGAESAGSSPEPFEDPQPLLRSAVTRETGPRSFRGKQGAVPSGRFALGPFDPGRRGMRALIVAVAVIAVVAGFLVWQSRPGQELVTPSTSTAPVSEPAGSATASGTIVVAVQGKVRTPGLVRLPAGARVADAIAAAGGALPDVDLAFVNVARRLSDGELIVIGQTPPPGVGAPDAGGSPGKIDLNAATVAELDTLPGIGPALAQRIVDYRTRHGAFRSVDDLRQVSGIGDAKFNEIKDLVTV